MGWVLASIGLVGFVVGALAIARGFSWKPVSILLLGSWLAIFQGGTLAAGSRQPISSAPESAASATPSPAAELLALEPEDGARPAGVPPEAVETVAGDTVDGASFLITGDDFPPPGQRVRLSGVDPPPSGECYGEEAKTFLESQLPPGSRIYLLAGSEDADATGALLRLVWNAQGELVNEAIVASGFARSSVLASGDPHLARVAAAGAAAEAERRGVWSVCSPVPAASPAPGAAASPNPQGASRASRSGCEPGIPDFCVPLSERDLDCEDIGRSNFRVTGSDPHNLDDGEVPGIGCESGDLPLGLRLEAERQERERQREEERREREEERREREERRDEDDEGLFPGGLLDLSDD